MKSKKFIAAIAAIGLLALSAPAQYTVQYISHSAYGNSTAGAITEFTATPGAAFRLVAVNYGSDSSSAVLNLYTGSTAYTITATNAATSSVTNLINSTNGLSAGATLLLEHAGAFYTQTVSSWNSSTNFVAVSTNGAASGGTNVVLNSGGWGVATSIGDPVYLLTSPVALPIGTGTNWLNGEALFVGNRGRPVLVQLTPATTSNKLWSVTGRYE